MSSPFRIELVTDDERFLQKAAITHSRNLNGTLTSARGAGTVLALYRHLVAHRHAVYLVLRDEHVVGGLVTLRQGERYSPLTLLLSHPMSWLRAVRRLGLPEFLRQIWDLVKVQRRRSRLHECDYILALYVDEEFRKHGLARQLLSRVITDARDRRRGLAVDTLLQNQPARRLYDSCGFVEQGRTSRSLILSLNEG